MSEKRRRRRGTGSEDGSDLSETELDTKSPVGLLLWLFTSNHSSNLARSTHCREIHFVKLCKIYWVCQTEPNKIVRWRTMRLLHYDVCPRSLAPYSRLLYKFGNLEYWLGNISLRQSFFFYYIYGDSSGLSSWFLHSTLWEFTRMIGLKKIADLLLIRQQKFTLSTF